MWEQVNQALGRSVERVLTSLAGFLPGVVALLLSVLVAALIGWLLAAASGRILGWFRFDERLQGAGFESLAEWSPARSPTRLVGRLLFWTSLFLGLLVGLAALDATQVASVTGRLFIYVPNVIAAAALVVAGSIVARLLSRGVLISAVNMQLRTAKLMSLGVKWLVLVLTSAMALNQLSIGGAVLTMAFGILFGGIVLALALAVGLGSKDIVSRTWDRQTIRRSEPTDPMQHL